MLPDNPPVPFVLRPIAPADNAAVAGIIREVMTEFGAVGPGYSIQDPEIDAMYEAYNRPRALFYVLENAGQLVGCGGIAPLTGGGPNTAELRKMYFLPEARGFGFGKKIVQTLEQDARRFGFQYLYLETIEAMFKAVSLYQKMGYTPLAGPMGQTGHTSCGLFFGKAL